jgi:hypothetical protein
MMDKGRIVTTEHLQDLFLQGLDGDSIAYEKFLSGLSGHLRGYLMVRLASMQHYGMPRHGAQHGHAGERLEAVVIEHLEDRQRAQDGQ